MKTTRVIGRTLAADGTVTAERVRTDTAGKPKPTRLGVFHARRIQWEDADGSVNEQYGVPAIVHTSDRSRTREGRRVMELVARKCGVKLVPIQFGEEKTANGQTFECVVAWLAIGDGDDASLAKMEEFLESGLVRWEHCTMLSVPSGLGVHVGPPKRPAPKPKAKPDTIWYPAPVCPVTGLPTDLTDRPVSGVAVRHPNKE